MRKGVQLALITILMGYCGSRPGAIVESTSYKNSGEALKYKDVTFVILEEEEEHGNTHFALLEKHGLLKSARDDPSEYYALPYIAKRKQRPNPGFLNSTETDATSPKSLRKSSTTVLLNGVS